MNNISVKNYEDLNVYIDTHVKTLLNIYHDIYVKGTIRYYRIVVDVEDIQISSDARNFLGKIYWHNFMVFNSSIIDDYPLIILKEFKNDIRKYR